MQYKDAASFFGRVGILIPLILIFLTAADSAFACPGHKTGVAYRTGAIKTKTVSYMPTTVISYRAPVSYRRCGTSLYDTRGAKYVAVRGSGTRYVAVRPDDVSRSFGRQRYGAVYDVDYGIARRYAGSRYVAVRRVEPRVKYVSVRNIDIDDDDDVRYLTVRRSAPRVRYVAVRNIDIDYGDEPRYVAVRRIVPRTRYVAVREIDIDDDDGYVKLRRIGPSTKYVALENIDSGCTRAVALRSCLDEVETTSVKHVALRNDNSYSKHVVIRDEDDDDEFILKDERDDGEYIAVASNMPKYVEYRDASYSYETPIPASTRTITYRSANDDMDYQAFIDDDSTTYVAADDIDDACLSRHVVETSPTTVSYVPVEGNDDEVSYVATHTVVPRMRYVALDEDGLFDDPDPTYVADVVEAETVSYAPVHELEVLETETMTYVPVEDRVIDSGTISYVPVEAASETAASYVPAKDIDNIDVRYVTDDECSAMVSRVHTAPIYIADGSTVLVEEVDGELVAELSGTQQIAGKFGYRDGFEDGQEAALEGDVYHPENSGDYKKATEGYEDDFGDKDVYKDAYRTSYLDGYRAGFESGRSV